jgi:hypothetical protein
MPTRVLKDNLFVDYVLYRIGEIPPPEVAARIGDHAWTTIDDDPAPVEDAEPQAPEPAPTEAPESPPPVEDEAPAGGDELTTDVPAPAEDPVEVPSLDVAAVVAAARWAAGDRDPAPPRAGRGASKDAWAKYAETLGVTVPAGASRDDIIAVVDATI